jgi:hypothetical protein
VPNKLSQFLQGLKRGGPKQEDLRNIDPWTVRSRSLSKAERLGYPVNPNLLLLDRPEFERPQEDVFQRALCLFVTSACAYGLDREKAEVWLQQERIDDALSPLEREFLRSGKGDMGSFTGGVEALFVVMWALGFYRRLNFADSSDDDLISFFPNPTIGESSEKLRSKARLRPVAQIFPQLDLAYCLHSAVISEKLKGHRTPGDVHPSVIYHRGKALRWLLSREDWDDIRMDA